MDTQRPRIRDHGSGLYTIDHPLKVAGLQLGTRTSILRLANGSLVLHSPGPAEALLAAGVEKLGSVAALASPCALHHLYLAGCAAAFPAARVYGPVGLPVTGFTLAGTLGDEAPETWRGQIDQIVLQGARSHSEVLFLHRQSRTLLVGDLVFNIQRSDSLVTRLLMRANGGWRRFGPTRLMRSQLRDRARVRATLDRVLAWDFDRVVVTHGDIVENGGREALRAGFAWLRAERTRAAS